MMRRMAGLAAALALGMWGAVGAAAQTGGTVTGRVTSTLHGEAVAGATVTLRGIDDGPTQTYIMETGSDGRFSIANIAPGTYEPRPSKTGYQQRLPDHFATAKDFPPLTIEAGKTEAVELRLIPDGVIAGRVLDNDGDPVRRAQVEAQQYGYAGGKKQLRTMRNAQTDDRGEYRLFYLPPGRYFLRVMPQPGRNQPMPMPGPRVAIADANGYQTALGPAYYPGIADAARATELQLAPGLELDGIDVRLSPQRLYSIRGRILLDGPKGQVSIYAQNLSETGGRMGMGGMGMNGSTHTEGDQYELSGIPSGRYAVIGQQFQNPQQRSLMQYARQVVDVVERDVDHADLVFSQGKTIKGVVRAEGSASLKDVSNVILAPEDSGMMMNVSGANARVAPDGTFTIDAPPGVYHPRVNGRQVYLKAVLVGKEAAPDKKIDTEHLSGDLTLVVSADYGKVEGTVLDDAGKPVYNADVTLIPDQRQEDWQQRFRSTLTKADGKFSFAAVEPGEYRAYAWLGVEQGAPQDAEFRKPFEDRAVVVKVEGNGRQTLELKAIQAAK
jgi:protocatechuate 3,4-dioxygenase beta subunit